MDQLTLNKHIEKQFGELKEQIKALENKVEDLKVLYDFYDWETKMGLRYGSNKTTK